MQEMLTAKIFKSFSENRDENAFLGKHMFEVEIMDILRPRLFYLLFLMMKVQCRSKCLVLVKSPSSVFL